MQPDDELCLCFHVTKRKVQNYLRIERPRTAAQLADCYGAGTGCGWCRPFLKKLHAASLQQSEQAESEARLPDATDYANARGKYVDAGKGKPPGA